MLFTRLKDIAIIQIDYGITDIEADIILQSLIATVYVINYHDGNVIIVKHWRLPDHSERVLNYVAVLLIITIRRRLDPVFDMMLYTEWYAVLANNVTSPCWGRPNLP